MSIMKFIVSFLACVLSVSACKTSKEVSSNIKFEGSFKISMLNTNDVSGKGLTFNIDRSTNKVSGNSGCNSYNGNYELSETNHTISFSRIFTTKMYCVEQEKNDIEREFLKTLSKEFRIIFKKQGVELEAISDRSLKISLIKSSQVN